MDSSEALVDAYLRHSGYTDILYEPDGNVPPDFLVEQRIAVEVRRLNQQHDDGPGYKGLEELAIPLWVKVRKLILQFGAPMQGRSWFVFYSFSRPVAEWPLLRSALQTTLENFKAKRAPQPFNQKIAQGFRLKLWPASKPHPTLFVPGGHSDEQSGGWLLEDMENNLKRCISEKAAKIAQIRHRYPEWWLVLPDHIGFGLDEFDRQCFRDQASISHTFDRVILLDPCDPTRAFGI